LRIRCDERRTGARLSRNHLLKQQVVQLAGVAHDIGQRLPYLTGVGERLGLGNGPYDAGADLGEVFRIEPVSVGAMSDRARISGECSSAKASAIAAGWVAGLIPSLSRPALNFSMDHAEMSARSFVSYTTPNWARMF
jgi:hypothetical protein